LSGLSGMVNGTGPADVQPASPAPGKGGPAIASADDIPPQSGGLGTGVASFTAH
jgi:hypothetical protein